MSKANIVCIHFNLLSVFPSCEISASFFCLSYKAKNFFGAFNRYRYIASCLCFPYFVHSLSTISSLNNIVFPKGVGILILMNTYTYLDWNTFVLEPGNDCGGIVSHLFGKWLESQANTFKTTSQQHTSAFTWLCRYQIPLENSGCECYSCCHCNLYTVLWVYV